MYTTIVPKGFKYNKTYRCNYEDCTNDDLGETLGWWHCPKMECKYHLCKTLGHGP